MEQNDKPSPSIPDKLYFKIGEVARIIGVEPYVLRYWETEFPDISPVKSKSRQRLYKKNDVELISQIRSLLYNQNYTIKGAKKKIKDLKKRELITREQIKLDLTEEGCPDVSSQHPEVKEIIAEMSSFLASD